MNKILVTGADGFIGSHLVEELVAQGKEVRAFCCYNSFNSWGWLDTFDKDIISRIDVVMGDVRDPHGVRKAMEGVNTVYHLAALIGIPYSYHSPDAYIATNIRGTLNILQAARDTRPEKILVTSTSEVYGTALYVPIDEKHPKQAQSPYSATKISADAIAESFYRSFDLPVVIARPFNTYGPRQSARAIIPTTIVQLLSGKEEISIGSLHPTRDFVYVKDTVKGLIAIAEIKEGLGEEINIATQDEISIGDIVESLIKNINPNARVKKDDKRIRPGKSEVERLLGSNEKITRLTGWHPKYSLEDGLKETIEWFKDGHNIQGYKEGIYNV